MKQEQVLHEKQKTKKRHKNVSREHFLFTNFDPKLCVDTEKNSHLHVRTGLRKQKIGVYKIFIFLQALNSNFRLSANRALIRLKQGNPRKNKAGVLDSESFESLSHLIKAAVNWDRPSTNETKHELRTPRAPAKKNSPLNSRENTRKAFGKTVNHTSSQPNAIQKTWWPP